MKPEDDLRNESDGPVMFRVLPRAVTEFKGITWALAMLRTVGETLEFTRPDMKQLVESGHSEHFIQTVTDGTWWCARLNGGFCRFYYHKSWLESV
jgi:hypothetical protein